MTSESSATANFIKLETPTFGDFKFTNTELVWNAPANANPSVYTPTYEVYDKASGNVYDGEKNGTRFDISFLKGGESYTFQVKAIGNGSNYINSEKSVDAVIYKLETPEVTRADGKYVWDSVASASSYAVYIDGTLVAGGTQSYTAHEYTPTAIFTEIKTYQVDVYAIGDNGLTTIDSSACTIMQTTKQLDTPEFSLSYSEEAYDPNGDIIVTVTKSSPNASRYSFNVGDAEGRQGNTELVYYAKPRSASSYEANVYAVGGNFDEDGFYYIDSRTAANKSIRLLASPNESSINRNMSGHLTWATITGAISYEIEYTVNGETFRETATQTRLTDTSKFKGTVVVRIRAVGDGSSVITGAWTVKTFYNQQ